MKHRQAVVALHWLGWSVLPTSMVLYGWVISWQSLSRPIVFQFGPSTVAALVGLMFLLALTGYGLRRSSKRLFHEGTFRFPREGMAHYAYLVVNALAIGACGLAMVVPLMLSAMGNVHPMLMALFNGAGVFAVLVCCPAIWPPSVRRNGPPNSIREE